MRLAPLEGPDAVTVEIDGESVAARAGESIAATMTAAGLRSLSAARDGAPRGLYCGMGVCHDCLVIVDGVPGRRACMTPVRAGMRIERQPGLPETTARDFGKPAPETVAADLLVVGAGPAGLAAATTAAEAGLSVLLLDERHAPGGQFFKQPSTPGAVPLALVDDQSRDGAARIARARAAGVSLRGDALVWAAERDDSGGLEIAAVSDGRSFTVRPRMLAIATGAYERPGIFPGWTLPGVMTAGAGQTLLRSYGILPGRHIVVAGNGPLNFQLADEMIRAGAQHVTLVEAASPPWQRVGNGLAAMLADARLGAAGAAMIARLRKAGVPMFWRSAVAKAVTGGAHGLLAFVGPTGGEPARAIECDAVLTGGGFMPSSELARLLGCACRPAARGAATLEVERSDDGATSQPDVFVIGEAGRFGGAHIAMAQGVLAGASITMRLGRPVSAPNAARRTLARSQRFQNALWRAFDAPSRGLGGVDPETRVCRCESVTLGVLRETIRAHGITDVASLKRLTRAGMGRCQGRYCAAHLHELVETASPGSEDAFLAPQAPLRPVPIAAIAAEKPEWRGHRRTALPARRLTAGDPFPEALTCGTVVIGAGVVGLATALYLAEAGEDVVVLEQSAPNAGASGGNAGSLHAQLLSFDFDTAAPPKVTPALATLPLQKASIALWQELESDLKGDFEIKVTGGLMVAESEDDLLLLEHKAAAERRQGIDSEVIDAWALRAMEPAISERFVGAAWCSMEGKINPLRASIALADAARRQGARLHDRCSVSAIERRNNDFYLSTSRGPVSARRVVNAAGPFARPVGALAGVDLPVYTAPLQMIVTEAVAPMVGRLVAHVRRHLTLKQAANGNLLIGGGWPAGLDPVHGHPRPARESLEGNLAVALHVVPALADVHVIRSWGALNIDIDGAPIIGEHPALPGFFTAVGANGYTLGPVFGRIVADLITRGRTDHEIRPFSVGRFARS